MGISSWFLKVVARRRGETRDDLENCYAEKKNSELGCKMELKCNKCPSTFQSPDLSFHKSDNPGFVR
jgi:hypothetical protein